MTPDSLHWMPRYPCAAALLALLLPGHLAAESTSTESFAIPAYAAGLSIDGQNDGFGWTPWTATSGVAFVAARGLTYAAPAIGRIGATNVGNGCLQLATSNSAAGFAVRHLSNAAWQSMAAAGTLWFRGLVAPPASTLANSGYVALGMRASPADESGVRIRWERFPTGTVSTLLLVTNAATGAGATATLPNLPAVGAEAVRANLLLVRIACARSNAAADSVSVWINPVTAAEGALGPPNAILGGVDFLTAADPAPRALHVKAATVVPGGQACRADEFALGTQFSDVIVPDTDQDGLPDDWEAQYGGLSRFSGGNHDADEDGQSDLAEWRAHTLPANATSTLSLAALNATPSAATLAWASITNTHYAVRGTRRLDGQDEWRTLASGLAATPPLNYYSNALTEQGQTFLRVDLDRPREDWLTDQAGGEYVWYREMNLPRGLYAGGRTYFCFHGGAPHFLDPYVMAYDHHTHAFQGPIKIGDNALVAIADTHGNPVINMDTAGFLHVIYGGHAFWGPMRHAVSARPYDITAWIHLTNINSYASYPSLLRRSDGSLYYFYRRGEHRTPITYVVSQDNGRTFGPERMLMSGGTLRTDRNYCETNYYDSWYGSFFRSADDTLHYITTYHACADDWSDYYHVERRVNVYYLRMRADGVWLNAAGEVLQLPVDLAQAESRCRIWVSPVKRGAGQVNATYIAGFAADADDNPRIVLKYGLGEWGSKLELGRRLLVGTLGASTFVAKEAPVTGSLAIDADNALTIFANSVYRSHDLGGTWTKVATIRTAGFDGSILLNDYHPDAMLLGTESRPYPNLNSVKIFLWGANGLLRR